MNAYLRSLATSLAAAKKRHLLVCITVLTLVIAAAAIADLATGGRPDPQALRAASLLLDGPWRFHLGDEPQWARPEFDDAAWEALDMTAAPGSHDGDVGLPDYVGEWRGQSDYRGGYAWYRRAVAIPAGESSWAILGPTIVEDGYELYWNGQLLGGSGTLGAKPRLVGTRPLLFPLPNVRPDGQNVLAIRTYMLPHPSDAPPGGGLHTPPILAPRRIAEALHGVQWRRTIAGYVLDAIEPAAMLALVGLACGYRSRSNRKSFLAWACVALTLTALRRLNNAIVSWTDLQDLVTYSLLASIMWVPITAAWVLAWNRWCQPAWRFVDALALAMGVCGIVGVMAHLDALANLSRLGSLGLLALVFARVAKDGPTRILALATLATILASLFGAQLLDPMGVPGIWFPFNIGVARGQYLYALSIPLLAFLIVSTFDAGSSDAPRPG